MVQDSLVSQDLPTDLPTENPTNEGIPTAALQEEADSSEEEEDVALKPKAKRNCISYAKKMILASADLFIDILYSDKFSDQNVMIIGQIKECPRASNGKQFRLEWKEPIPFGVQRLWLCNNLVASRDNKAKLQQAMLAFENSSHNKKINKSRAKKKQHTGHANFASGPPTEVDAVTASASVRTSSTISSLSQNTIASPEVTRTRTRSLLTIESDSDDGDDLVEDDNMYGDPNASDAQAGDSDAESDATSTAGSSTDVLAQLLSNVEWNFTEENSIVDDDAPFPYIGPSGLKPGVAESFTNPFECLSLCGLDYDLVSRLARNSNEYARRMLLPKDRNNRLQGVAFTNITTEEMYHFLGITLVFHNLQLIVVDTRRTSPQIIK
jgi:hypothetical protein